MTAALAALRARGVDLFTPADRGVDRRGYEGTVPVERILKIVPEDWRVVGDDFRAATGITAAPRLHPHYLSTYCHHQLHDRCRLTCKVCGKPCVCPCHGTDQPA